MGKRLAVAGPILEDIGPSRRKARGNLLCTSDDHGLRYALTERGRTSAQAALDRSGYVGPAPVPLKVYTEVVEMQSVRNRLVTRERMHGAFIEVVLDPIGSRSPGPAFNSGKALLAYGAPGTGKTYITQRLARLIDDAALIPHAITVGDAIIRIFDATTHVPIQNTEPSMLLDDGHDPRFVLCRRPVVATGGELSADMLEVQFDAVARGSTGRHCSSKPLNQYVQPR